MTMDEVHENSRIWAEAEKLVSSTDELRDLYVGLHINAVLGSLELGGEIHRGREGWQRT